MITYLKSYIRSIEYGFNIEGLSTRDALSEISLSIFLAVGPLATFGCFAFHGIKALL